MFFYAVINFLMFIVILLILFLIGTVLSSLFGPKKVSEKDFEAMVTVEDTYYRMSYNTPVMAGKVTTFIRHPSRYEVYVKYNGEEYSRDDISDYNYCKNLIGKKVKAIMRETTYEDGSVCYSLVDILN